jgi:hypothetical protein
VQTSKFGEEYAAPSFSMKLEAQSGHMERKVQQYPMESKAMANRFHVSTSESWRFDQLSAFVVNSSGSSPVHALRVVDMKAQAHRHIPVQSR